MKIPVLLIMTSLAGVASADRLFSVPVARTIPTHSARYERLIGLNNRTYRNEFFAFTPLSGYEFEVNRREDGEITGDAQFNFLPPIASISPGISVGVLDFSNHTDLGRRGFVAFTFRELLEVGDSGANGDFTLGYQFGHVTSGFFGASLPLSQKTNLIFEHNGVLLTAGINSMIYPGLNARLFVQDQLLLAGFRFSARF